MDLEDVAVICAGLQRTSHPLNASPTFDPPHPDTYLFQVLFQVALLCVAKEILLAYLRNSNLNFRVSHSQTRSLSIYFTFSPQIPYYLHCLFLQCCRSGFYCDYFKFFLGLRGTHSKSISLENDRKKEKCKRSKMGDKFPALTLFMILIKEIHFT